MPVARHSNYSSKQTRIKKSEFGYCICTCKLYACTKYRNHVCIYICVYAHGALPLSRFPSLSIYFHVYRHAYVYIYIYREREREREGGIHARNIRTYIHIYMYMYINMYVYMCVYVSGQMCIYINIYAYVATAMRNNYASRQTRIKKSAVGAWTRI